jgi:23S rRNA pseudoU1915 N3-methylase RlmH
MILIAAIENHKNSEIDALCNDYVKRCAPMHAVKLELLPAARTPDPETQKAKESETLLKMMKPFYINWNIMLEIVNLWP